MKRRILCFFLMAISALGSLGSAQNYAVIDLSVAPVRSAPDFSSEMVTQALLGTPVHVLDSATWFRIQTPDGYEGWVHYAVLTRMSRDRYHAWNQGPQLVVTALSALVYAAPSRHADIVSDLVAGDRLRLLGRRGRWWQVAFPDGRKGWVPQRDGAPLSSWRKGLDASPEAILSTARSMNGFPYLWAGMSPKGMDCSGFVRTVLFLHDIIIPRDASQQALCGERIDIGPDCAGLVPGDFLFFGRRTSEGEERVGHVGLYLGDRQFIHCLGRVQMVSTDPASERYDAYNTGRLLFAARILPYIGTTPDLTTSAEHPFYQE